MTAAGPRISAPAAAQRLRLVQRRWPAAAQLARLLSLAVRIEPSLLRAARLAAGLDAAAEADLWFSGIVASSGTLGISFGPAVAEALRGELAASPDERALAWNLVKEHHGQQPWSIRLEERINYLTTGPPAEASEIEDLLAAALTELHEVRAHDEQAALGIARWLLAALARAPAAARATPTAAAAELAAGVHLDGRLGGADQLTQAEGSELLPWLLDHLGTTVLPVRLLPGAVALGGDPPDGVPLPVPVTDPLVVSVIWGSGPGAHHEHVRVPPGEELLVPVDAAEVELRTLAGGGVVLRRAGIGRILVSGVDRGAGFAVADYAILTAAHVLGSRTLHSGRPTDPARSSASDASASEAQVSEGADDGSGPVSDVVYVPEGGDPLSARIVASDPALDVVLLQPERPVPATLPVGQIQPGQQWRLQTLPEHDPADSRQRADVSAASFRGVIITGDPRPRFRPTESTGSLRGQVGAAVTLENPWGAVIGLLVGETPEPEPQIVAGEGRPGEARPLRVAPIDAIVARFNLARQITVATAALVDGRWPERQQLEDLVALSLRDGVLPVVADVEPTELGLSPGQPGGAEDIGQVAARLQAALAPSTLILFAGAAGATSLTAYGAVRAQLPDARLLVPKTRAGTLMALTADPDLATYPERVVVWLDDLPRYISETGGGLESLDLSAFNRGDHLTVLIGTISGTDLDRLRSDTLRPGLVQRLLDRATVIRLPALEGEPADAASSAELDDERTAQATVEGASGRSPASFLPSRDGFAFTNAWPSEPDVMAPTPFGNISIGNADAGLGGGMVFAALDYRYAGIEPPAARPAPGQTLYRYLVQRLIDSWHLPAGAAQYYQWMNLPDGETALNAAGQHVVTERGLAWRTIQQEWPQIAADLDNGTPVTLGVVTVASADPADLGLNHQVLAYGYSASPSQVTIQVYDPNSGQNNGIHIRFDPRTPSYPTTFTHNLDIGRPVRGFFRIAYTPITPPAPTPPTVTGISPATGSLAGGDTVTVVGSALTGVTAVSFGPVDAANVTAVSDTELTVISPAGAEPGAVDVTVTAPAGTSEPSPAGQFTYVPGASQRGVFLSYRREDASPYARLLQLGLSERIPDAQIFMDLDAIEPGQDFAQFTAEAVSSSAVLVALIGRQWATLTDEDGLRRLDNPRDYVRLEVKTALERGVWVIPVLVDGAKLPRLQDLPADLHNLARLQVHELRYDRYEDDANQLLDLIQRVLTAA